jgi:endonuclease/exonuclease/phosphatase family metal-dependent hydrolase
MARRIRLRMGLDVLRTGGLDPGVPHPGKEGATAPEAPTPLRLKVMTWNVKYGAGASTSWFDLWGDRVEMTLDEVELNMGASTTSSTRSNRTSSSPTRIESQLQRSAYYDMVKGVLDHTDLRWAAYVPLWQNRYVASEGVGRVDTGNCVFSRYPIVKNERIAQVDRTDQSIVVSTFYWHRAIAHALVQVGPRTLSVYGVHTEAYDMDRTNFKQQQQILELAGRRSCRSCWPATSTPCRPARWKVSGFNDEAPIQGTDSSSALRPRGPAPFFDELHEAIPLERYGTDRGGAAPLVHALGHRAGHRRIQRRAGDLDRRLDYLFIRKADRWLDSDVLQTKAAAPGRGPRSPRRARAWPRPALPERSLPVVGDLEVAP